MAQQAELLPRAVPAAVALVRAVPAGAVVVLAAGAVALALAARAVKAHMRRQRVFRECCSRADIQ